MRSQPSMRRAWALFLSPARLSTLITRLFIAAIRRGALPVRTRLASSP